MRDVPVASFGDGTVDVLLGLDAAALMVPMEVRRGHNSEPYAELSWVIAGSVSIASVPGKRVLRVRVNESEDDLAATSCASCWDGKFWEV